MRNWTCHWQWKYWRPEHNPPFKPITAAGSNLFVERGVKPGDRVFVVSLSKGLLYLGGRMTVSSIVNRDAAVRLTQDANLYDGAEEWILGSPKEATPLHLQRSLSPAITARIRFRSPSGEIKPPFFVRPGLLDVQATRGVRQITDATAKMLEAILKHSDRRKSAQIVKETDIGSAIGA